MMQFKMYKHTQFISKIPTKYEQNMVNIDWESTKINCTLNISGTRLEHNKLIEIKLSLDTTQ